MSKDVQCTITNVERAQLFLHVFGTPTVYVENPIGEMANLPGKGACHVYKLDMAEVTPEQKAQLASALSARFGIPLPEITVAIEDQGIPVLAEDCVLTVTGAAARSLFGDNIDWRDE